MNMIDILKAALQAQDYENLSRAVDEMRKQGSGPEQIFALVEKADAGMNRATWDILIQQLENTGAL